MLSVDPLFVPTHDERESGAYAFFMAMGNKDPLNLAVVQKEETMTTFE